MQDFAQTCEAVAATRSRLEKASILQAYFSRLTDVDLALAARYLSGRPFPLSDQRVLNVGYANVRDALLTLVPTPDAEYNRLVVRLADMGDVAYDLLSRRNPTPSPSPEQGGGPDQTIPSPLTPSAPPVYGGMGGPGVEGEGLTLSDLADLFDKLAAATGSKARAKLLTDVLARATALEAKYVVKIVMGELRIGLQEGQVEDAVARAYGVPVAAVQWTNMLLGDLGETAVLARYGRLAEARMRLFHPIKFMLASPAETPAVVAKQMPDGFFVEDKYDGVRAQVHKQGDRLAIYSRTLDEVSHRYPELHDPLLALPGEFILDGEILGWREGRAIPFTEFQPRLGRKTVDAELLTSLPVVFMAFDLLYQDGAVLLEEPLTTRRRQLMALLKTEDLRLETASEAQSLASSHQSSLLLGLSTQHNDITDLALAFEAARERGNEGLMVKALTSTYKPGRRGKDWLKIKRPLATLDVVVTGVEWGNGKRRHVLSDYTFAIQDAEGQLLDVGKAYSGLTDAEIAELTEWFQAHTLADYGKFRRVEPLVVLEVAFDQVQASERHPSGYALRFPRIVRIRTDKLPADIDTLDTVRTLAHSLIAEVS